jgi:cobalt/nickel transport system permease protein
MSDRVGLLAYLAAVVAVTGVHSPAALAGGLAVAVLIAGRRRWRYARRALLAVALFNGVVTLSYAALALWQGRFSGEYVLLLNLRVLLLTYLTFLAADRVNLLRALAFSPTLGYLVSLAYSQSLTFRRVFQDFRQALASRSLEPPSARAVLRHGAATGSYFVDKSLQETAAIGQALRSRGFFDG